MKISNEQLRALQEIELRKTQQNAAQTGGDFGGLLAQQLDAGQSGTPAALGGLAMQGMAFPALNIVNDSAAESDASPFSDEAATRMDGMFTSFERYANQIGQGGASGLREAYGTLQDVSERIAGFKAAFPNAAQDMPEMSALLNELDVLTTTETFKFNRGDYM